MALGVLLLVFVRLMPFATLARGGRVLCRDDAYDILPYIILYYTGILVIIQLQILTAAAAAGRYCIMYVLLWGSVSRHTNEIDEEEELHRHTVGRVLLYGDAGILPRTYV